MAAAAEVKENGNGCCQVEADYFQVGFGTYPRYRRVDPVMPLVVMLVAEEDLAETDQG